MTIFLAVLGAVAAVPGVLAVAHLSLLVAASTLPRRASRTNDATSRRFLFLVPAHDEEPVLADTLAAIAREKRAGDHVVVVADHCTDGTADIARAGGAIVVERSGASVPGKLGALIDGLSAARDLGWDYVIVLDADSVVEPGFVPACTTALAGGAAAAQARSEAAEGRGGFAAATRAAFALQGVALPRGRSRLHLCVRLRGTGMVLRRDVVESFPFPTEGASEDLRYSLELCLAGVLPLHIDEARLRSANPPNVRAATGQRVRWEAGRLYTARLYVRRLVRTHRIACLEAALHLVTPPLALAALSLLVGAGLGLAADVVPLAVVCFAGLGFLALDVAVAMLEARVRLRDWLALCLAPAYIAWKAWVQVRALFAVRSASSAWERTPRDASAMAERS